MAPGHYMYFRGVLRTPDFGARPEIPSCGGGGNYPPRVTVGI